jgi:hypothetical protein
MGILLLLFLLWIPALLGLAAWAIGERVRCLATLEAWAKAEGVRIVRRSRRRVLRGPFAWYPSTCAVFVITVEGDDGLPRRAWVSVNAPSFTGLAGTDLEWWPES